MARNMIGDTMLKTSIIGLNLSAITKEIFYNNSSVFLSRGWDYHSLILILFFSTFISLRLTHKFSLTFFFYKILI